VGACLGLTLPLDFVKAADHRPEVDCTELLDVEPGADELKELPGDLLICSRA